MILRRNAAVLRHRMLVVTKAEFDSVVETSCALAARLWPDQGAITVCYYCRGVEVARWTSDRYGTRHEVIDDADLFNELARRLEDKTTWPG